MPRFYFELTDGLHVIEDRSGRDLPTPASAREFASSSIRAFGARCAKLNLGQWPTWSVRVLDENGAQVFIEHLPAGIPAKQAS